MSDSDILVSCEGVSKKFCKDLKKSLWYGVKDVCRDLMGRPLADSAYLREKEFLAVSDLTFELRRGECLGIVGRNGAGKTTLLKLLSGLIKPDTGSIMTKGRLGALISVGAGFNPILTGRENVYANGSVLGLTKREITERFDEILEFSGIAEFIDSPVRTYSSGMQVRLGMAIAAHIHPDILLLDEILAVGDLNFQRKCMKVATTQMDGSSGEGPSGVILVSHNMEAITKHCSRVIVMEQGAIVFDGSPREAIKVYFDLNKSTLNVENQNREDRSQRCSLDAEFTGFQSVDAEGNEKWEVAADEEIALKFSLKVNKEVDDLNFYFQLRDSLTENILTNSMLEISKDPLPAGTEFSGICKIQPGVIRPGMYALYCVLSNRTFSKPFDVLDQNVDLPYLLVESKDVDVRSLVGYFNVNTSLQRLS